MTFGVDDGIRVYVDDVLVLDEWASPRVANEEVSLTVPLATTPLDTHTVVIEYREFFGHAFLNVQSVPDLDFMQARQPITNPGPRRAFAQWELDTFAAAGQSKRVGAVWPNSMNMGLIAGGGLGTSGDDVWVADSFRGAVRLSSGGAVAEVTSPLDYVRAFTADGSGRVFFATSGCSLKERRPLVNVFELLGTGCNAGIDPDDRYNNNTIRFASEIRDIAVDDDGRLYVLDGTYLWRTNPARNRFEVFAGNASGPPASSTPQDGVDVSLGIPRSVAIRGETIIIGTEDSLISIRANNGDATLLIGPGGTGADNLALPFASVSLASVYDVAFLDDNRFLIVETYKGLVRLVNLTTETVTLVAGETWLQPDPPTAANVPRSILLPNRLSYPSAVTITSEGIYVLEGGHNQVRRLR
jgi:hypothetical protein